MLDTHVAWLANQGMNFLSTGENPPPGQPAPQHQPVWEFPTKDGYLILAVGNDPTFERFCKAFGRNTCSPTSASPPTPSASRTADLVTQTLTPLMKSRTTTEWVDALEALKIAAARSTR